MLRTLEREARVRHLLARPQAAFVTDADGGLMVQAVLRYESLQRDFDALCAHLRLPSTHLARINASPAISTPLALDDTLKQALQDVYAEDFSTFGYDV